MALKIESIETIPVRVPLPFTYQGSYYRMRNRCTIITRVRTSEGIVGEAYNADEDEPLQAEILSILHEELVPRVIGLDAFGTERVWEAMLPATFDQLRPRWYAMQAMACIDTAVWDAVGKALGQPLWRLWGGYRDRIPMIGIGGYYIPEDGAAKGQEIEREIDFFQGEHGMVGMKFKVGAQSPAEDAARLRRARDHAGDDFLFVVDANQGYTVPEALDFLAAVRAEGIELRWFEEPTRWHADFRGLRDVRYRGNVAVAAGQSEISRVGMREMMVAGAIDVCNYDASWGGGPSGVAPDRGPGGGLRRPARPSRGGPGGGPPARVATARHLRRGLLPDPRSDLLADAREPARARRRAVPAARPARVWAGCWTRPSSSGTASIVDGFGGRRRRAQSFLETLTTRSRLGTMGRPWARAQDAAGVAEEEQRMRIAHRRLLVLMTGASILAAACSGGGAATTAPSASSGPATQAPASVRAAQRERRG